MSESSENLEIDNVVKGRFPLPLTPFNGERAKEAFFTKILVDDMVEYLTSFLLESLEEADIDISEDDSFFKDLFLVQESMRSLVHKVYTAHHPLQDVAEKLFIVDEETGVISYSISLTKEPITEEEPNEK